MFAVTVVGLFSFLRYGQVPSTESWVLVDTLLALQFAIPHSLLLHPSTRRRLRSSYLPSSMVRFLRLHLHQSVADFSILEIHEHDRLGSEWDRCEFMIGAFYLSWAGMLYSISLTGLGFQTGWTQWQYWYRGEKLPRRDFEARGAYRVMRHPVYLCFLGLIWFTPKMTVDHALLTGIWTIYIGLGSILKDQRLSFYLGDSYRLYMEKVAGYPLMISGPLARRPAGTRERFHDDSGIVVRFSPERVLTGLDESTQQCAA